MGSTGPNKGGPAVKTGEIPIYSNAQLQGYAANKSADAGGLSTAVLAQQELDRRNGVTPAPAVAAANDAAAVDATRKPPTAQEQADAASQGLGVSGPLQQKEDKTGITRGSTGPLSA
jgi:hypothetical protein